MIIYIYNAIRRTLTKPWCGLVRMQLSTNHRKISQQDDEKRVLESEVLEKHCLYSAAILGASLWASWITWMPFLHVRLTLAPSSFNVFRVCAHTDGLWHICDCCLYKTKNSPCFRSWTAQKRPKQQRPFHIPLLNTTQSSRFTLSDRFHCSSSSE